MRRENERTGMTAPRLEASAGSSVLATESRRLQRLGGTTLGVSLPRGWVSERSLNPGDPVHLRVLTNGSILVRDGSPDLELFSQTYDLSGDPDAGHLLRRLIRSYLSGVSLFDIRETPRISPEVRTAVSVFTRRTVRTEIVSDEPGRLVLQEVSRGGDLPIPTILRRMVQIVLDRMERAGLSWSGRDEINLEAWRRADDEVDRNAWLVERILALRVQGAEVDPLPIPSFEPLLIARTLERIADHAVLIARRGTNLRETAVPRTILATLSDYHRQVTRHFADAADCALGDEERSVQEILDAGAALHETRAALGERIVSHAERDRIYPPSLVALELTLESLDRVTSYALDLAELSLSPGDRRRARLSGLIDPEPPEGLRAR